MVRTHPSPSAQDVETEFTPVSSSSAPKIVASLHVLGHFSRRLGCPALLLMLVRVLEFATLGAVPARLSPHWAITTVELKAPILRNRSK